MSDLRIVLLGKSVSENSRVGNFILGRAAFDSEAPLDVVERIGGRLKDRRVIMISSPQLFQTNISDHQITQTVRECVNLSAPGPHVIIIILQHNDFTKEHMRRVKQMLKEFSEEAIKRTIVLTTDAARHGVRGIHVKVNELIQQLTTECGGGHLQFDEGKPEWHSEICRSVEIILQKEHEPFLICDMYENTGGRLVDVLRRSEGSFTSEKEDSNERNTEKCPIHDCLKRSVSVTRKQKLNLVLCGSHASLKTFISKLIREKRRDMAYHGLLISLVELPALINTRVSEETVMLETLHCVSLCEPGVHVFLFIIPDAPLTDEDKTEMEEIQRIFSSRVKKHIMILIIQAKSMTGQMNINHSSATETSIQTFGGRCFVLENSSQVPDLLQDAQNMVKINKGSCYTTFMCLQARVELDRNKYKAEIEKMRRSMMKTQPTAASVTHNDDLRIVLLGKTGVGKSATGNTILRRQAFKSLTTSRSVTRECKKETSEFKRRQIAVIDSPGMFDTAVDHIDIRKEIVKCISMAAPGPHVFLLVIPLGRFTKEEKDAVKMIQEIFGDQSRMYTMVLFTKGDDLRGTTIQDFIEDDGSLQYLVQQCGKRYHVFNNKETEDQMQVSELLEKIDRMVAVNGGSFFTNKMFQQVEKNIKEEQEKILEEKEEEIKRKEEELRANYKDEIEQMKKENEREKQEIQKELRKRENELKKKEEEIKKETDGTIQKEHQRKLEEKQREFEEEYKRKEKDLGKQLQNLKKYLEEKHEDEKKNLKQKIQYETRKQAECEYLVKYKTELAKALKISEEKHKAEKLEALREAEEKYKTEKILVIQEVRQKYETEVAKTLREAKKKQEAETVKALQENEEKYKTELSKILQDAEKKQDTEVAKAIQKAKETHQKENVKALQAVEENHKREKAKVLQEAEEKHKREKAKALREAEEKYKAEKAEAEAKVPYRSKRASDWSHYVPVLGGAAGGLVGTVEDIIYSMKS